MPRKPRLFLENTPCHVVQRGNNRQACFFNSADYPVYLEYLENAISKYECRLHAYVLMTNHVHLLLTPEKQESIPRTMQALGRNYVYYVNKVYGRTGTLWEGRYKCSLVQSENYLMSCYRYVELNPLKARMVKSLDDYPWSSYHFNAGSKEDSLLTPHPVYVSLGSNSNIRSIKYREFLEKRTCENQNSKIQALTDRDYPLGDEGFRTKIEMVNNVKLKNLKLGRPEKGL